MEITLLKGNNEKILILLFFLTYLLIPGFMTKKHDQPEDTPFAVYRIKL